MHQKSGHILPRQRKRIARIISLREDLQSAERTFVEKTRQHILHLIQNKKIRKFLLLPAEPIIEAAVQPPIDILTGMLSRTTISDEGIVESGEVYITVKKSILIEHTIYRASIEEMAAFLEKLEEQSGGVLQFQLDNSSKRNKCISIKGKIIFM